MNSVDCLVDAKECLSGKHMDNNEPDLHGAIESILRYCIMKEEAERKALHTSICKSIDSAQKHNSINLIPDLQVMRDTNQIELGKLYTID